VYSEALCSFPHALISRSYSSRTCSSPPTSVVPSSKTSGSFCLKMKDDMIFFFLRPTPILPLLTCARALDSALLRPPRRREQPGRLTRDCLLATSELPMRAFLFHDVCIRSRVETVAGNSLRPGFYYRSIFVRPPKRFLPLPRAPMFRSLFHFIGGQDGKSHCLPSFTPWPPSRQGLSS